MCSHSLTMMVYLWILNMHKVLSSIVDFLFTFPEHSGLAIVIYS